MARQLTVGRGQVRFQRLYRRRTGVDSQPQLAEYPGGMASRPTIAQSTTVEPSA